MLKLSGEPGEAAVVAQKRRVPVPRSGSSEGLKFLEPEAARSAVTYDLFTWATKHNRREPVQHRKIKVPHSVMGGDRLTSREQARSHQRLQNYFEFGAGRGMKAKSGSFELNVYRNRIIFVLIVCALVLYSLSWLAD